MAEWNGCVWCEGERTGLIYLWKLIVCWIAEIGMEFQFGSGEWDWQWDFVMLRDGQNSVYKLWTWSMVDFLEVRINGS